MPIASYSVCVLCTSYDDLNCDIWMVFYGPELLVKVVLRFFTLFFMYADCAAHITLNTVMFKVFRTKSCMYDVYADEWAEGRGDPPLDGVPPVPLLPQVGGGRRPPGGGRGAPVGGRPYPQGRQHRGASFGCTQGLHGALLR